MDDALIKTGNVNLTNVGLTFNGDLQYEEWIDLMQTLVRLETAFQFAIGDALVFGEARYGEKYSQVMEVTQLSYQSLANMVWVSKKVPIQNRNAELSWTHHRVIASVDQSDQVGLLEMARIQGLSATDLQHHISGKPQRNKELIQIPSGISALEAAAVLQQYADATIEARSGDATDTADPSEATLLSCILCSECPYKSGRSRQ
jgi:hypothetical protein